MHSIAISISHIVVFGGRPYLGICIYMYVCYMTLNFRSALHKTNVLSDVVIVDTMLSSMLMLRMIIMCVLCLLTIIAIDVIITSVVVVIVVIVIVMLSAQLTLIQSICFTLSLRGLGPNSKRRQLKPTQKQNTHMNFPPTHTAHFLGEQVVSE